MIAAKSGIHKKIESGQIVAGYPQLPYRQWLKVEACRVKLPGNESHFRKSEKKSRKVTGANNKQSI